MALTDQEKAILDYAKTNGKSLVEGKAAIQRYRQSQKAQEEVSTAAQKPSGDGRILGKTQDVLGTVFGGGKIGEAIGTQIAKARATPEEREFIEEGPTGKQVAGDVLRTGALFTPVGKFIKGAKALGATLGLTKGATTAGSIAGGGTAGLLADTGQSLAEGGDPRVGLGTVLGAGIPAASPVIGAISRVMAKGTGKIGAELSGALTGTSAETLEQAFIAARQGGDEAERFTRSLRGRTTPEALVDTFRENVGKISSQRQALFRETLEELGDEVVDTVSAKSGFSNQLKDAGVLVTDAGLDFSKSKLKLVPAAQTKISTAWDEVSRLPQSVKLTDVDTTRQALKALKSAGDDPSANLANKLIDDAVRGVRGAGEKVPGYKQMLDNFGETTEFLDELQRGLTSGEKATVDQTYRKMATALKTNNEQRMALVRELDVATDGAILSQISGQQLSELMPRGIFRQIAAGIAGGAVVTGGASAGLIPALVFASPRVTGEFVRALGIGTQKANLLIKSVEQARSALINAGAITGAVNDDSDEK
jgi:hypothetical protein